MDQPQKQPVSPRKSNFYFSLPLDLKEQFARICAENDTTASQKIRHLMSWYIQKNTKEE